MWVPLAAAYKTQWGRVRGQLGASTLQLMHAILPWTMVRPSVNQLISISANQFVRE